MRLRYYLWGTIMFYATVLATYNRRKTTIDETAAGTYATLRKQATSKQAIAQYRQGRIQDAGTRVSPEYGAEYVKKEWVR